MTAEKMEKIAVDMLACKNLKEVSEKNKISDRTLRRLRRTADFQAIQAKVRAEAFDRAFDAACAAAQDSVRLLVDTIKDPAAPASARVSASRSILDLSKEYYNQIEILDRLSALESIVEGMHDYE